MYPKHGEYWIHCRVCVSVLFKYNYNILSFPKCLVSSATNSIVHKSRTAITPSEYYRINGNICTIELSEILTQLRTVTRTHLPRFGCECQTLWEQRRATRRCIVPSSFYRCDSIDSHIDPEHVLGTYTEIRRVILAWICFAFNAGTARHAWADANRRAMLRFRQSSRSMLKYCMLLLICCDELPVTYYYWGIATRRVLDCFDFSPTSWVNRGFTLYIPYNRQTYKCVYYSIYKQVGGFCIYRCEYVHWGNSNRMKYDRRDCCCW